jgi:hypothetical protein
MKRIFSLLIIGIVFFTACKTNHPPTAGEKTILSVEQVLADPSAYVNKEIVISGTVSHVCKMDGKKMFLFGANADSTIRITTGPNLAYFDVALEGNEVEIVGVVKELRIDEAYLAQMEEDLAKGSREKEPTGQEDAVGKNQNEELSNVDAMREQIKASGKDHISEYWIEQISIAKKDSIQ